MPKTQKKDRKFQVHRCASNPNFALYIYNLWNGTFPHAWLIYHTKCTKNKLEDLSFVDIANSGNSKLAKHLQPAT